MSRDCPKRCRSQPKREELGKIATKMWVNQVYVGGKQVAGSRDETRTRWRIKPHKRIRATASKQKSQHKYHFHTKYCASWNKERQNVRKIVCQGSVIIEDWV